MARSRVGPEVATPESVEALQHAIGEARARQPLRFRGGGTKPALSAPRTGERIVELSGLPRSLDYDPSEFTVTASASLPLHELTEALAQERQWLAFDPPLAAAGATVGGTVAANGWGPARGRFGGVRDAILETVLVNGSGELVRGGARVVKNAAGFDLPKLQVGSCGSLGALVSVTFKVLPSPGWLWVGRVKGLEASAGARIAQAALGAVEEPLSAELAGHGAGGSTLTVELAGPEESLEPRARSLASALDLQWQQTEGPSSWSRRVAGDLRWAGARSLARIPAGPAELGGLVASLVGSVREEAPRWIYSGARELLVAVGQESAAALDRMLRERELTGLLLTGPLPAASALIGADPPGGVLLQRVRAAFDPRRVFAAP